MKNKPIAIFIISINILFFGALYNVRNIPNANPYFIFLHILGMVTLSLVLLYLYVIKEEEFVYFEPINLFFKGLGFLALLLAIFIVAHILEESPYGSLLLVFTISVISGILTFVLLGCEKRSFIAGERAYNTKEYAFANLRSFVSKMKPTKNTTLLIFIFLLGFFLRWLVLGLPLVPVGNDTPMYLLPAVKGSQLPLPRLLAMGFSFSGEPYQDTINFATLWLGTCLKLLNVFGFNPVAISKVVMPLISSLSIIALYFLAKSLTNEKAALYSALFFAIMPTELIFAQLYKEILGVLLLLVALCFFVKYIKNRSALTLFIFAVASFFLLKTAVTVFLIFFMFIIAYTTYLVLSKRVSKRDIGRFGFIFLVICGIGLIFYHSSIDSLFAAINITYARFENAGIVHPYAYYSFPIMVLTDLTVFLLTISYFLKGYIAKNLTKEEKSAITFSFSIFISIFIYSFFVSCLLSYHLFPSSLFYYSLRASLYLGIPFAIMGGLFLYRIEKKIEHKKVMKAIIVMIILLAFLDFGLTAYPGTTIHRCTLSSAINESTYTELNSLNFDDYDVICCGNFSVGEYGLNGSNLGLGHWLRYIVYSKMGKEPVFIESLEEVDTDRDCLVLYCDVRYIYVLIYNHEVNKFTPINVIER